MSIRSIVACKAAMAATYLGLAVSLAGCNPGQFDASQGGGTGSIAMKVVWLGQSPIATTLDASRPRIRPLDTPPGVQSVVATVNSTPQVTATFGSLVSGQPGAGTIDGVPPGGPYTVTLNGFASADGTGASIYSGTLSNIFVSSGQATTPSSALIMTASHGGVNPSFGINGNGSMESAGAGIPAIGRAVAIDPLTGKIYVIENSETSDGQALMTVWRFTADGHSDPTWGQGLGYITDAGTGAASNGFAGVITSAGLVVSGDVTGSTNSACKQLSPCAALWRFSIGDGSPDNSFSTQTGHVALTQGPNLNPGSGASHFAVIEDQSSPAVPRNLVMIGQADVSGNQNQPILSSFSPHNGDWNPLFCSSSQQSLSCNGGSIAIPVTSTTMAPSVFGLAMDGAKIVVVGSAIYPSLSNTVLTVWRYSNSGTSGKFEDLDGSGSFLIQTTDTSVFSQGFSVVVNGGNYTIAGNGANGQAMEVWRYSPGGGNLLAVDPTFNATGFLTNIPAGMQSANVGQFGTALAVDPLGRVLVAGNSRVGTSSSATVWRVNPDGTLDSTFGEYGTVSPTSSPGYEQLPLTTPSFGIGVNLDAAGNIYVAGVSGDSGEEKMTLWKFKP